MARFVPHHSRRAALLCAVGFGSLVFAGATRAALIDNLELYYNYDNDTTAPGGIVDGSGNARDASGVDKNASSIIDYSFSSDVPASIAAGRSLDLQGTTDYVISDTPGYTGVTGAGARTVATWVKFTGSSAQPTLMEWGANINGERWALRLNTGAPNGVVGALRVEVAGDFIVGTDIIDDGQWHHVAATFSDDGSPVVEDVKLYVDGVLQTTFTSGPNAPAINTSGINTVTLAGSQMLTDDRSVNGLLDETAIWSRVLSEQEIIDLAGGAVIPEPASLALLGLGGMLVTRRRR